MRTLESGLLIIYSSPNGRENWMPVKPDDVPGWIKNYPDTLARMVDGEIACKADEPDPIWFRAEKINTPVASTDIGAVY